MNEPVIPQLMIFARWPRLGKVKTRLAATVGDNRALDCYLALLSAVTRQLRPFRPEIWWDAEPEPQGAELSTQQLELLSALSAGLGERVQEGDNLGERMRKALSQAVREAGAGIIVGSDCPAVTVEHIRHVIEQLRIHDVVLIPSDDGGYVLIGSRVDLPQAFDHARWGTGHALEDTVQALSNAGLSIGYLPELWDVDTWGDWERWQRTCPSASEGD